MLITYDVCDTGKPNPGRQTRAPQDVRTALRIATAAAHEGLHRHHAFAELLHGELARREYANLMLRLFGLHAALERRIAAHLRSPWFAWYALDCAESRSAALRRDLVLLGTPPSRITAAVTADGALPAVKTAEAALGCAWVVEASTLGGSVLARHVAATIGAGVAPPPADPEQPARWTACCEAVSRCATEPGNRVTLYAAAAATFDALDTWLSAA